MVLSKFSGTSDFVIQIVSLPKMLATSTGSEIILTNAPFKTPENHFVFIAKVFLVFFLFLIHCF